MTIGIEPRGGVQSVADGLERVAEVDQSMKRGEEERKQMAKQSEEATAGADVEIEVAAAVAAGAVVEVDKSSSAKVVSDLAKIDVWDEIWVERSEGVGLNSI
jgi:hypothetical protein